MYSDESCFYFPYFIEDRANDIDAEEEMSRITIERVIESITSKFNLVIQEALEKASITKDLIDVVYIVGEATPLSLI